jgi:hypothetical protein
VCHPSNIFLETSINEGAVFEELPKDNCQKNSRYFFQTLFLKIRASWLKMSVQLKKGYTVTK